MVYDWTEISKVAYEIQKANMTCENPKKLVDFSGTKVVCGTKTDQTHNTSDFWREATSGEVLAGKPCNESMVGETIEVSSVEYKCGVSYFDTESTAYKIATSESDYEYFYYESVAVLGWYDTSDNSTLLK